MKNKGRRHKSGRGPWADGNQKGSLCGITRSIEKMSSPNEYRNVKEYCRKKGAKIENVFTPKSKPGKFVKKKWTKRVRGYFKSQTKDLLNQEY